MARALLPHDTCVADLVGRSVVARGTDALGDDVLLAARFDAARMGVAIRWSTPSGRPDPWLAATRRALGDARPDTAPSEEDVHRVPRDAALAAALLAVADVRVETVARAEVRWPWRAHRVLAAVLASAAVVATVMLVVLSGDAAPTWAWAIAMTVVAGILYSQLADGWATRPARVLADGRVLGADDLREHLPAAPRLAPPEPSPAPEPWAALPLDTPLDALDGTSFLTVGGDDYVLGGVLAPTTRANLQRRVEAWLRVGDTTQRHSREVSRHQTLASLGVALGHVPERAVVVPRVDWAREQEPGVRVGERWLDADALLARVTPPGGRPRTPRR